VHTRFSLISVWSNRKVFRYLLLVSELFGKTTVNAELLTQ